jgi:transposase
MAYGISNSEINKRIGITFPTLRKYKNVLKSGEIEELVVFKGERTKSALDDYEEVILKEFDSNPPKTLRDAKERILRLTGLNRSLHRIRVWLEKRGSKAAR